MKSKLLSFLLASSLIYSAAASLHAAPAASWELKDLSGKTVKLSDFKGKVVILDFWATWCPPCRAEIPNFVALQAEYGAKGLMVVGVSLDQGSTNPVAAFVKAQKINYPIVMGNEDVTHKYGDIQAIPTTFVIDPKGNIVSTHIGQTEKSVFEDEIKPLLSSAVAAK